jgi:hypothetical protein
VIHRPGAAASAPGRRGHGNAYIEPTFVIVPCTFMVLFRMALVPADSTIAEFAWITPT